MIPVDPNIPNLRLVTFAKDQKEYLPLPARMGDDTYGTVVTCWKLNWRERIKMLFGGKVYLTMLTFRGPLQPVMMDVDKPKMEYTYTEVPA